MEQVEQLAESLRVAIKQRDELELRVAQDTDQIRDLEAKLAKAGEMWNAHNARRAELIGQNEELKKQFDGMERRALQASGRLKDVTQSYNEVSRIAAQLRVELAELKVKYEEVVGISHKQRDRAERAEEKLRVIRGGKA